MVHADEPEINVLDYFLHADAAEKELVLVVVLVLCCCFQEPPSN